MNNTSCCIFPVHFPSGLPSSRKSALLPKTSTTLRSPVNFSVFIQIYIINLRTKKGALDSHPQVIKFTGCLPSGSLRVLWLLPPPKLVDMISLKVVLKHLQIKSRIWFGPVNQIFISIGIDTWHFHLNKKHGRQYSNYTLQPYYIYVHKKNLFSSWI